MTGELLCGALAARAAIRAGAALLVVVPILWELDGGAVLVSAVYVAAVVGAATLVERAVALRALRREASAWRCGAQASLACAVLHAAAMTNAALWLSRPGLDVGLRQARLAEALHASFAVPVLLGAWLLAGPSGSVAMAARLHGLDAPHRLPHEAMAWLAVWSVAGGLWAGPAMAASMPSSFAPAFAVGAAFSLALACTLGGLVGFVCLCVLDRLAGRVLARASG